jgi:hypothetical protein
VEDHPRGNAGLALRGRVKTWRVVVTYPSEGGGYTPGDTWTLFVGPDKRVKEFIYHRGGSVKPTVVIATWADYKKAGPLLVSTDHRGTADGKPARIFFSDVSVMLAGSNTWVNAQNNGRARLSAANLIYSSPDDLSCIVCSTARP